MSENDKKDTCEVNKYVFKKRGGDIIFAQEGPNIAFRLINRPNILTDDSVIALVVDHCLSYG